MLGGCRPTRPAEAAPGWPWLVGLRFRAATRWEKAAKAKKKRQDKTSTFRTKQTHLPDHRVISLRGAHVRRETALGGAVGSSDDDVADEHAPPFFSAAVIHLRAAKRAGWGEEGRPYLLLV